MTRPIHIAIENACKAFRLGKAVVPVLDGLSLEVRQGEFLTFSGPTVVEKPRC